jgi:hypothetical protein
VYDALVPNSMNSPTVIKGITKGQAEIGRRNE